MVPAKIACACANDFALGTASSRESLPTVASAFTTTDTVTGMSLNFALAIGVSSHVLPLFCVACVKPPATPDVARAAPTLARRRRERRIRSSFRHEQMTLNMAVLSAQHHSAQRCCSIATQADEYVATSATFFNMSDGKDPDGLATPVIEYAEPAPVITDISCLLEPPVPPVLTEYVAPAPAVVCDEPAPVIEYMTPDLCLKRLVALRHHWHHAFFVTSRTRQSRPSSIAW